MKSNFGWVKYLAIAFGLVLALGIISSLVHGGIYVLTGLGLIENKTQLIENEAGSYSQEYTGSLSSISIVYNVGSLILQTSDEFKVEGTNLSSDLTAKMEDGKLIIQEKGPDNLLSSLFDQNNAPNLVVTIPKSSKLESVDLELGAGRGEINGITTDNLSISQGAGEITATDVQANAGELKGGAGSVNFSNVALKDFDIDGGVGLIKIQGAITGKMKIDCGVGQTSLNISGNPDDYFINADQGLGAITINGQKIPEKGTGSKTASNRIDINGGVGPVNIVFD
ncbi:DUF4097 family beta strand repeat-containing protein [Acetobacterium tundrae]|uniref:DUF4097 family beta strand repeat protein n=1 Tax=Acetobacterium tundrae TaxID=132932 RepID=A0ABR6WIA9_9FIRM|nr:DUF4097 family beta strand repeat-containing protein [Acetobacterium tundrae]MBC3796218.1 DUF4097 family beta strand repeat protein [Acetobacterium tundrae]